MEKLYKVSIVNRFTKAFIEDVAVTANSKAEAKVLALKMFRRSKRAFMAASASTNFKYLKVG